MRAWMTIAAVVFLVYSATYPLEARRREALRRQAPPDDKGALAHSRRVVDEFFHVPAHDDEREESGVAEEPRAFDALVFGNRGLYERPVDPDGLLVYLEQKITTIDLACGLSAPQKQKLALAGRGDLRRLFERVEEARRKYEAAGPNPDIRELMQTTQALADALRSDPFDRNSLFEKTAGATLNAEQLAKCAALTRSDRLTGVRLQRSPQGSFEIREIRMPATEFRDEDLARLNGTAGLRNLVLDSTPVTDAGLATLSGLFELEQLDLGNTRIDGSGFVHLARLTSLRELDLRQTRVTSESLVHLRALTGLKRLHLEETWIGDQALAHLAELTNLRFLFLRGTAVTDAGLAQLRKLRNLRQLDLGGTAVTDAGLVHLSGLSDLELLDLQGTRVSDAGISRLAHLPLLRHAYFFDTPVTAAGIEALQRTLTKAKLLR